MSVHLTSSFRLSSWDLKWTDYCIALYCVGSEVLAELKPCTTSKFPLKKIVSYLGRLPTEFSPRKIGFSLIIMSKGFVVKTVNIIMGISGPKASIFPCQ